MRPLVIAPGLAALVAACSTPTPSNEPSAPAAPAAAAAPDVVATFEGSFDAATQRLTITMHAAKSGAVTTLSLPYGTAAGDVYLHTEGTGGDGKTDPPAFNATTKVLSAVVDGENGTGVPIAGFSANFTSFSPSSSGMIAGGTTTCAGASVGGGAQAAPCAVAYGTVAPNASFPTPVFTFAQPWAFYAPSGSFSFQGNVTGTLQPNGPDAGPDSGGHSGTSVVPGGVAATSPNFRMTTTTGQSPGGNATLSSPSFVMTGGIVGATQGK